MKFNDITKRILAIIVVLLFVFAAILPLTSILASADNISDLQKKIQESQSKKKNIQSEINEINAEKNNLLAEIKAYDTQIEILKSEIEEMNQKIAQDDAVIADVQKQLDDATAKAEKQYETYKERIRVMYENGTDSFFEILLNSESFSDFLNKYEIVKQISEYDSNMVDKLEQIKKEIADKKSQLEAIKEQKVQKMIWFEYTKEIDNYFLKQEDYYNKMDLKSMEKK